MLGGKAPDVPVESERDLRELKAESSKVKARKFKGRAYVYAFLVLY